MPRLLAAVALASLLPAQTVTWRFTDDGSIPTCPTSRGQPCIEDPGGQAFAPQSFTSYAWITWQSFTPRAPVMLSFSLDQSRNLIVPCMLVSPDICLFSVVNPFGECRFGWPLPLNPPLTLVPIGTATLGVCQVIQLDQYPTVIATASSYVVNIESVR